MAKLHSKKKGKSGTKRPKSKTAPGFTAMPPEKIKEMVVALAKEGITQAKIGLVLRDRHGVPSVKASTGMTVGQILMKEKAASEYPEDLLNLIKKAVRMRDHLKAKKKDTGNKVKLMHVESKIQRLVRYYLDRGALPAGWKYDPEKVALLVK